MTGEIWNPWHGCVKYSEGCQNCYVYRRDDSVGRDASETVRNAAFDLPLRRGRDGQYKLPAGSTVFTCMTSDFFLEAADGWRDEIWEMIRRRSDLHFFIITKRIVRFFDCMPDDWGIGYPNVSLCCTMESQKQCDLRFPFFNTVPARSKYVACEPLLTGIDMSRYLTDEIRQVTVGGESGGYARPCRFEWVLDIRRQCMERNVPFYFKQTGTRFVKDGKTYYIERRMQGRQARKAGINT